MDVHLLGLEAGDLRGDLLVHALELGPSPDLALARSEPHRAVLRLHRRVREIRHGVFGLDGLDRPAEPVARIASLGRSACLRSSISRFIPIQYRIVPSVARRGSARVRNQRYAPAALRTRKLTSPAEPVLRQLDQTLRASA